MVPVQNNNGVLIKTRSFEIIEEGLDGSIQVVGCCKIAINGFILLGKIGGIKEVMVAPLFVGCITVPEASGISVENCTGLVAIL